MAYWFLYWIPGLMYPEYIQTEYILYHILYMTVPEGEHTQGQS